MFQVTLRLKYLDLPGPGSYRLPSEFGYLEPVKLLGKTLLSQSVSQPNFIPHSPAIHN